MRAIQFVRVLEQRARLLDDPRTAEIRGLRLLRADALAGVLVGHVGHGRPRGLTGHGVERLVGAVVGFEKLSCASAAAFGVGLGESRVRDR